MIMIMIHKFSIVSMAFVLIAITGVLILLMFLVDPSDINAFGLLGILAITYIFFFVLFMFLYRVIELIRNFFKSQNKSKDPIKQQKNQRKIPYIIAVLAFIPLFLISFNSLGQVNILTLSLIVLFEVLAIFYIVKRV